MIKKIKILTTQCNICKKTEYEDKAKFTTDRNLRNLGVDICETCNQNYDILTLEEVTKKYSNDPKARKYKSINKYLVAVRKRPISH